MHNRFNIVKGRLVHVSLCKTCTCGNDNDSISERGLINKVKEKSTRYQGLNLDVYVLHSQKVARGTEDGYPPVRGCLVTPPTPPHPH